MAPKLANELWIEIIRLLPRSDLLNMSRTNKLLHELTEPTLYSNLDTMKHKISPDESLMLFFRTIVNNPALARHVKRATIHVLPFNSNATTRVDLEAMDVSSLKPSDHATLESQITRLMPDKELCESWHTTILNTSSWDSIAGFILLMVSQNLEYLNIHNYGASIGYFNINSFILYWSDSTRGMDPDTEGHRPFSQLREVNLHKNDDSGGINFLMFNTVERYLKFDSIIKFTGHGITDAIFETDGRTTSPVEHITLVDCRLTNIALKNFLLTLRSLNTLEWFDSLALATCNFYNTIREVPRIKDHLEKLVISDYYETVRSTTNRAPFFDLEDFSSLKTLIVDSFSALGPLRLGETDTNGNDAGTGGTEVDNVTMDTMDDSPKFFYSDNRIVRLLTALPPTLEYLKITDCRYPVYDCALRIATRRDPKLSNLKELTLAFGDECRSHTYVPSKGRLAEYKMIAKKHGIKLTFLEFVE